MSIRLNEFVEKGTYSYTDPVRFKEENYFNSRSLVQAFLDDWDYAVTTFKCGDWKGFWDAYVDADAATKVENSKQFEAIYNAMWDGRNNVSVDVLFAKVIHYFEPALKVIPCFINYDLTSEADNVRYSSFRSISLWSGGHIEGFFRRELSISEQEYLMSLMRANLKDSWNRKYNNQEEVILYACQMLSEKVFSLYGYEGAEDEFLALLSDTVEADKRTQEEYVKAYQGVADRVFKECGFYYKGNVCNSLEEFGALWKGECDKWSLKEWTAFIKTLYEQNVFSFRQWLIHIGETKLYNYLEAWREEEKGSVCYSAEREESFLPKSLLGEKNRLPYFDSDRNVSRYVDDLNYCLYKPFRREYTGKYSYYPASDEIVSAGQSFGSLAHEHLGSKRDKVLLLMKLFPRMFQYLEETIGNMPKYDSSVLKAELDTLLGMWDEWEEECKRIVVDLYMLKNMLCKHDIASCWNHNFTYKPYYELQKLNARQQLVLLACSSENKYYQKNCEAFLKVIEEGGEGCAPEDVQQYVEAIIEHIYGPVVFSQRFFKWKGEHDSKLNEKDSTAKKLLDEQKEYYFRLLEKLSEKLPVTIKLSDIMSDKGQIE